MKYAITTFAPVLLSLKAHVGAMIPFALQAGQSSFPILTEQVTGNMNPQPKRILQSDEIQCPVCGRFNTTFGVSLLPDVTPYPDYPEFTCGFINSNEGYDSQLPIADIVPKCPRYQDLWEEYCCDLSESLPRHECEQNARSNLFANYSTVIVPSVKRGSDLSVKTLINYWAVKHLDLTESSIEVFLDVQISWNDPRLAWNVTSDNCATSMSVRASNDVETTDIWVPALDLLNRDDSMQDLAASPAQLYSDGTVRWNRSGKLTAFCSFIGLRRMPFDTVGCQLMFGSTAPERVTYDLLDRGDEPRGLFFPAYNQTYAEYRVVKEKSKSSSYGPGFTISLFFVRSRRHYVLLVILPTILFVILSFGQFFFDSGSGERVTFGVSALLIIVAQSIVTSDMLPLCKETIWLNSLITSCQIFVLAGVFQALILFCATSKRPTRKTRKGHLKSIAVPAQNDRLPDDDDDDDHDDDENINQRATDTTSPLMVSKRVRLLSTMLWIDQHIIYVLPAAFTLYLVIMFAINKSWDDDPNEVWSPFE